LYSALASHCGDPGTDGPGSVGQELTVQELTVQEVSCSPIIYYKNSCIVDADIVRIPKFTDHFNIQTMLTRTC